MFRFPLPKSSRESNRRPAAEAIRRGRRAAPRLETMEGRVLLNAGPTIYNVTSTSGSASVRGSLPYEVALANANPNHYGSSIRFMLPTYLPQTITLDQTLTLSETAGPLTIFGASGGGEPTIDGNHQVQDLAIRPGVSATLYNLTIADGSTSAAGAGIGNNGTLTLVDCTLMGNSARMGGGLYNGWKATLTDCTIADNHASGPAGGVYNDGVLTAVSDTIADNTAYGNACGGLVSRTSATLLVDTIVADNTGMRGRFACDTAGTISSSSSYNLIGNSIGGGLTNGVNHNQVGVNPLLSPLGRYSSPTPILALLPGSPAIGAGSSSIAGVRVPTFDQRDVARPSGSVDIGAFQDQSFHINLTYTTQTITLKDRYTHQERWFIVGYNLTATVSSPYGDPVAGGVVTFTLSPGAPVTLEATEVSIADNGQAVDYVGAISTKVRSFDVTASARGANSSSVSLWSVLSPPY